MRAIKRNPKMQGKPRPPLAIIWEDQQGTMMVFTCENRPLTPGEFKDVEICIQSYRNTQAMMANQD